MNKPRPFLVPAPRGPVGLDRLTHMGHGELQQLFGDLFGCEIPSGNTEYARRRVAWYLQAERESGLPDSARQYALAIARDSRLRVRIGANVERRTNRLALDHTTTTRIISDHDSRLPMPGSVLVKKYKGRTIIVNVLNAGFEYGGQRFSSLTAIAYEITGTKWNGFAFFGLAKGLFVATSRQRVTPSTAPSQIRCAIYTRKSTEEGLDQEFNTLDAQREAGESYVNSQRNDGWTVVPDRYDDGGFTGANMDRPALKALLADVQTRKVNCIVVYKVDRFSRSLLDFMKMMEILDKHGVTFVSVTQPFNTTTSPGRLLVNMLFSFAQFEREMISERTRDKMRAARRKGKWVGGNLVLGYDLSAKGGALVVNRKEADRVQEIFRLYLELDP